MQSNPSSHTTGFKLKQLPPTTIISGLIILLGALLRIIPFLHFRSLWLDEAMLGLNIVEKPLLQLLSQPLDYNQGAPLLFLLIEKLFVLILGGHDWVLRLFPLFTGIVSLFLFAEISKRLLENPGRLIALFAFAVSPTLIYYSSEAKQYSADVMVALILFLLLINTLKRNSKTYDKKAILFFLITGVIVIFCSHPALFLLGGIAAALIYQFFFLLPKKDRKKNIKNLVIVFTSWTIVYIILYLVSLRDLSHNEFLTNFWYNDFMPIPPWKNWLWFLNRLITITNPFGLVPPYQWSIITLMLVGLVILFKKHQVFSLFIFMTFLLTMLASGFQVYPFGNRMILFLLPFTILCCASTIQLLFEVSINRIRWVAITTTILLSIIILYGSFYNTTKLLSDPYSYHRNNVKEVVAILKTSITPEEPIYIYHDAVPAFLFYWYDSKEFQNPVILGILSRDDKAKYMTDLDQLNGYPSAWIVYSHLYPSNDLFEDLIYIKEYLDTFGVQDQEIIGSKNSFAHHYQFKPAD